MEGIVQVRLKYIQSRLVAMRMVLHVTEEAKKWLAQKGYDPAYGKVASISKLIILGARPLNRLIQRTILNPLAKLLLSGAAHHGQHIVVDADQKGLTLSTTDESPEKE